jgi:hypothetical protein
LQSEGHDILLPRDTNETPGKDSSNDIGHLTEECTPTDFTVSARPDHPPATYKHGSERKIDYMLGTLAFAQ